MLFPVAPFHSSSRTYTVLASMEKCLDIRQVSKTVLEIHDAQSGVNHYRITTNKRTFHRTTVEVHRDEGVLLATFKGSSITFAAGNVLKGTMGLSDFVEGHFFSR